ncbi:unnamed protein product [Prunus armeniaca]
MTGTGWGQTRGTTQVWKNRRNTGKKFCLGHIGQNLELIMPSQNRGKISSLFQSAELHFIQRRGSPCFISRAHRQIFGNSLSGQCIAIENNPLLKLRLFGNSLSGQAFTWYTNLPANSIQTLEQMESVFHDYYYRIQPEVTISDLAALKQSEDEPAQDFINRFRKLKMKCRIPMEERHFIQMAQAALKISLRKRFHGMLFGDLAELADKASK